MVKNIVYYVPIFTLFPHTLKTAVDNASRINVLSILGGIFDYSDCKWELTVLLPAPL